MASRDINLLVPELREKYYEFDRLMRSKGIDYIVTCTARTILEQMALYVQGRLPADEVVKFREVAGMRTDVPLASLTRKVTWTLNSRHVTNMFDKDLDNDLARAFDIAIIKHEGDRQIALWNLKADVNDNDIPDYEEAGSIGESVGLVWGGRWKPRDLCHFQLPGEAV